jgi:hypothetical protein
MTYPDKAQVEIVTVEYFRELEYRYTYGSVITPNYE